MKKSMNSKLQLALVAIMATFTTVLVPLGVRGQSSSSDSSCPGAPDQLAAGTLASVAYQGLLKEQGIPASATLVTEVQTGKITAQQIVQAAIDKCILSTKYNYQNNEEYLADVEKGIEVLKRGGL